MYNNVTVSSWVEIGDGCTIRFEVGGSGLVCVTCGGSGSDGFEFAFGSEALREFLRLGADAMRQMDATYAQEQAQDQSTAELVDSSPTGP